MFTGYGGSRTLETAGVFCHESPSGMTGALGLAVAAMLGGGLLITPVYAGLKSAGPGWTLNVSEFPLATYEPGVVPGSLVASSDGKHVAYVTMGGGGKQLVWHATKGSLYQAVGPIVISPDGSRLAYPSETDGQWFMVIDGTEEGPYDNVLPAVFSPVALIGQPPATGM